MSKWSWFFLIIPVFGVGTFVAANQLGCSLPEGISPFGQEIDHLYYMILWITGIAFVATQAVLCYTLYRFGRTGPREKVLYTHGSRTIEIAWTVGPAIILLFIALYQLPTYIKIRFPTAKPNIDPLVKVVARQFEWRLSYAGPDGKLDTTDDIHVVNDFHITKNRRILIDLRSMDVLHSFFLPNIRIKQDAVPGLAIPVWFEVNMSTREYQSKNIALRAGDVKDLGDLLADLKAKSKPIASFLFSKLSPATQVAVTGYDPGFTPTIALTQAVIADLNKIIDTERLQDDNRLKDLEKKLSFDTREHLSDSPGAVYQNVLNRQILADIYPNAVARPQDFELVCAELCGWGHYKMRGRMVVHDTQEQFARWLETKRAEQEASR